MGKVLKTTLLIGALAMTGCASTPMPKSLANHFDSARDDSDHARCMSENAMFNNRQLMVAPNAVQNAWTYCARKSDIWIPADGESRNALVSWESR